VNWKSLFKDGSFQKQVGSGFGARVRTSGRRLEMVRLAAEAKFEDALRASKRDLSKAERQQEALTKDVEERLKRQERVTRKDAKDLSAGFKRQLDEMREENREVMQALRDDVEEKERGTRINVRELRQKVSSLMEQVGQDKQDQADLAKQLTKEQKKRTVLMGTVDAWKDRHADLDQKTIDKDNRLKVLERDLAETVREKKTLVIRGERDVLSNRLEVDKLKRERQELNAKLAKSHEDVSMLAEHSCQVCSCHCNRLSSSQFFPYPYY
jgi:chromosome segregation ATPase